MWETNKTSIGSWMSTASKSNVEIEEEKESE